MTCQSVCQVNIVLDNAYFPFLWYTYSKFSMMLEKDNASFLGETAQ